TPVSPCGPQASSESASRGVTSEAGAKRSIASTITRSCLDGGTEQRVAGAAGDRAAHDLARRRAAEGDQHFLKARRAAHQLVAALGRADDEDLFVVADAGLVLLAGVLLLQLDDLSQASLLDRVGHVVLQLLAGVGDLAIAVGEHERE